MIALFKALKEFLTGRRDEEGFIEQKQPEIQEIKEQEKEKPYSPPLSEEPKELLPKVLPEDTIKRNTVEIKRYISDDSGTFGEIYINDKFFCYSVEPPWRNNQTSISCIPEGKYVCIWNWSNAFKRQMYLIKDVSGRSGVRIHSGNFAGDRSKGFKSHSFGCPLLGVTIGRLEGQQAVLSSRPTVQKFEETLKKESFTLIVGRKH